VILMGGITQLWLCPYPHEKQKKEKLVQTHLLSKAVLANLADLCTEKVCTQHTDRYIYIYKVANFTKKWEFFFFSLFFSCRYNSYSHQSFCQNSLSLSILLSLSLSLSLSVICVCVCNCKDT
jgi:hypothetical protein